MRVQLHPHTFAAAPSDVLSFASNYHSLHRKCWLPVYIQGDKIIEIKRDNDLNRGSGFQLLFPCKQLLLYL